MRQPAFPSAFAAVLAAAAAMPAAAVDVLVDFDHHRDGSPITVASGQVLRDAVVLPYLAEYGITIADRSRSGIEIRISRPTQAAGTSPFNVFEAWAPTLSPPSPYSYRMVFDQPVSELSFVRAALVGLTSHDAWQVTAFDGQGVALGSVSEPQVTQFGGTPAADARAFSLPYQGIASIVVLGNLSAGGQTYESLVLDDLRFNVSAVPEPGMWALWAGGLVAIALRWRRSLLAAGVVALAGCAGTGGLGSGQKTHDLRPGMSPGQVQAMLGAPANVQLTAAGTVWKYSLHEYYKGWVPYYLVFAGTPAALQGWAADESEYQRMQAAMLQAVQKAAPPAAPRPPAARPAGRDDCRRGSVEDRIACNAIELQR